jgi:5'-deoxynucleotidase YfbR-like HD superfamily hydrolase
LKLYDYYSFDLLKALRMAISHDISETLIGEICHSTKVKYPELKMVAENCERQAAKELLDEGSYRAHVEFMEGRSIESQIVLLADTISCLQFVESEISLGNIGYIHDIKPDVLSRINDIYLKLRANLR